jgi:hypothetical protein
MADYYPLISRAVAGLEKNNGENRRALYERARAALLAQLRGVTPALSESDITRERLALEESIRKVEAESARQFVEPSRQPPAPKIRPIEPRPPEPRAADSRQLGEDVEPTAPPPRRYVNPPPPASPEGRTDPLRRTRTPSSPSLPDDRPLPPAPAPSPQQPRHPLRRSAGERHSLSDTGLKDFRDVVSEANEPGGAAARAEKSARDAYAEVPSQPTNLDRPQRSYDRPHYERAEPQMLDPQVPQERLFEQAREPQPHQDFSEPMLESSFALEDQRPAPTRARRAPPPVEDEPDYEPVEEEPRRSSRGRITKALVEAGILGVVIVCVVGLGFLLYWQWPNMVGVYRTLTTRAPTTEIARDAASPSAPKKDPARIEPGSQQSVVTPTPGTQSAAVAQKVVLYEEDPADPNGKRFVGSAIWRTETVTPGPGQPPDLAVRADVEVPERKLAMTWMLRRNTDKGLPATHTVEIMFKLPADFPAGGISNVPGILMKQAEQTRGVPLAGSAVKVTNGFYLIGLSNTDDNKERNLQLLKERAWFDIPVVYNNNRRAILAIEKGTPGERVFADAFKAWKQ